MDDKRKLEELQQEIAQLKKENKVLHDENKALREEGGKSATFKEKYAVKILESLPDMLTVFDHMGYNVEVVSNEESNHVGISNAELIGRKMCDIVPDEAYRNIWSNMQRAINTGKVSAAHHELDVNGEHHYYENRIFPLDEKYVLIMCRDITSRVDVESEMQTYKRVLDRVSDSVLALSTDGTLVYANKKFIEEYHVTQELGKQKIYDLPVTINTPELWAAMLERIRNHGGNYSYRADYRKSGKNSICQVSTFLNRQGQEEVVWFFTQDITDVIHFRDELREQNYLLESILNNIPVYLFVKDPANEFRYLYWNKAFAAHSGIPASKAIGHTDIEIFPNREDADRFHADDLEVIRTKKRMDMQETYVSTSGETRVVQTMKTLVPMDGRESLIIGISWDVTDMENIEQELIKARIKAEQSDHLKTAFLANMSHEIRTPLNAIVGFSKLLTEADNPEDEKLYSDIINQNSEILLQLINDILDLAKIEAGTLEYVKHPMDLGELCRNVYEIHKTRVQDGVTLVLDNDKDAHLIINEDQNRVMQVVTNLINNAIKFTMKGEIHFGYEVRDDVIDFHVSDTGMGIPADKVDRVFDRFVKLNDFVQGTGLGLAICKMILKKAGGNISVTSEEGKGTTFHFIVPYEMGRCRAEIQKNTKQKVDTQNLSGGMKTILIAEDVDSNYLLLKSIIGKSYNLLWAKDGEQAVKMFKENDPDLILMDIKMPNMDGLEATRIIRSYSMLIPIVTLTAYAFESDREQAFEAGCSDFLTKPVQSGELKAVLGKYLE